MEHKVERADRVAELSMGSTAEAAQAQAQAAAKHAEAKALKERIQVRAAPRGHPLTSCTLLLMPPIPPFQVLQDLLGKREANFGKALGQNDLQAKVAGGRREGKERMSTRFFFNEHNAVPFPIDGAPGG